MGVFAYKGRNGRGDLVEGTLDGDDSGVIADQLMNTGITPIEIIQFRGALGGTSGKPGWIKRQLTEKPITAMDLMLFSRQMYTLLKAGVPIMRALAGLQESTQNPAFSALLQDLRESLDSGRELSAAMRRHPKVFSQFYISMVQVGEMTGMLDTTFIRLFEHLEFERDMRERIQADARIVEHVPGIAAPGLQCLDVVLEADDGIGQTIEIVRRQCQAATGLHHAPEVLRDVLDDVDRSCLAEHQQAGLDAAHELRPTIEARGIERAADVLRNVFLDARQIHHALAQHRALNLVEILILRVALAFAIGGLFSRQDQTDQLVVQVILDVDEPCGHLYQRALAAFFLARHDGLEPPRGFLHAQAQLAEAEYAERIADFLKQTDLRREFLGLAAAAAHEDVEHILDLGQILADRRGHRMHELDRGCGKILALLLDRLIDRQQFGETE